jgi:hypothetical protein
MSEGTGSVVSRRTGTRVHRSEAAWRAIFQQQRASSMTIDAFCHSRGIGRSTFNRWQSLLRSDESNALRSRAAGVDEVGARAPAAEHSSTLASCDLVP